MATYTHRVQTMLTEDQYRLLSALADQRGEPLSSLIREAVEETYMATIAQERRLRALERLMSLDAPVADWPQMEAEIERGAME